MQRFVHQSSCARVVVTYNKLFSYSYKNRHACMGTPDRMQCTYSPANVSPARKKFKRILRLVEPATALQNLPAPIRCVTVTDL